MRRYSRHFIGGAWRESNGRDTYSVINPASEVPVAVLTLGNGADVDAAVDAARGAFPAYAATTVAERILLLKRIMAEYQARASDLAAAVSEEMGAPISFAQAAQVPAGLGQFAGTLDALRAFVFEETVAGALVLHEPIGVVGMITPWNWPLNQICAKVAAALAAGNTMILKPSEEAPGCAVVLAEILEGAGVPVGVFNLVNGDGAGVGAAIAAHPGIDMVSFTGSTRAGILVARSAAVTVKRVHQELGGKGANLVLPGADMTRVLPATLQGVLANSGQSCIAPTRLLVQEGDSQAAIAVAAQIFSATPVGASDEAGMHIGPVVNANQYDKIQELIRSALADGARLVVGGLGRPDGFDRGYYVQPTLLADVTPAMRIFREEVFGPVATVTTYGDLDEAIMLANDTVFGLSSAISGDPKAAMPVARRIRAGMVTINSWATVGPTPFGGFGQSGNGREGGRFGIADFTEIKVVAGDV
ncbi:aldehyde dehydrogenase family protein [Sphingomonas sp. RP10(2022)]|uniref:aldehyde dehydrogenase (NAD(+)) n=1 Tax=Sphingomonas liriopis TaxID=2949094 RepID=A0A9X2KPL3_9SPHN|nr:aldehyde dehydrogenase family protein [Sphingomonas liriopis]MCP3734007.1 aldehyde dehydrogenase family protein [Sphingomonas liriopis]